MQKQGQKTGTPESFGWMRYPDFHIKDSLTGKVRLIAWETPDGFLRYTRSTKSPVTRVLAGVGGSQWPQPIQ